ncbi:MAG: phosphoribosylaminoimidazolesuccinocarboxamide synthase [Campylobacterota bacterium]
MQKQEMLYEGKAKKIYKTGDDTKYIAEFKDDLTAFNNAKKGSEEGKGSLNCQITTEIFKMLEQKGIKTHYVDTLDSNNLVVEKVTIIPIEVIVRNVATGSLSRRLGIEDGKVLPFSLVEFCYKDDDLDDPIINDEHAILLECVDNEGELEELRRLGREVNTILKPYFLDKGLRLIDFKLEFGKDVDGNIILADEITPDSCRFWDAKSNEKMDKDRFREGIGSVKVAYEEVLRRLQQ